MRFGRTAKIILSLLLCIALLAGCAELPFKGAPDSAAEKSESAAEGSSKRDDFKKPQESSGEAKPKEPSLVRLQDKIAASGAVVGAAFLGYIDGGAADEEVAEIARGGECASANEFLIKLSEGSIAAYKGTELYAFVPVSDGYAITVYPAELNALGEFDVDEDNPIIAASPGEAVILRCNESDLYSNAMVRVSDGANTAEFYPMVSLMDGKLAAAEGCYDFSVYSDNSDSGSVGESAEDRNIQIAYELLTEADEIKSRVDSGMVAQYTGYTEDIDGRECYIFILGTDNGGYITTEYFYGVCDNLIYSYDAIDDRWNALGAG